MILETAVLHVKPELDASFVPSFIEASALIASMKGYVNHELRRCLENRHQYLLLVWWETLEDHTVGFRQSAQYQEWRRLLHHYYEPFPVVEHYENIQIH
ncbi:antibiotic biosynthesis monooxygenase [Paenibacillus sp. R14(2021)]|uniref:antibiotic biosynthesis monooxygenase family protein n=1 Tax=Paenibacillus sp. R14(2021) TaxID=2859228 RepID=UPI001C6151B6|nr:antibiotic biosynthesis monooxygenase [Paenibacillus sp. R14(2021)]